MRDTELYRHLLGLEAPWTVTRVELNVKEQRVDVWAGHEEGTKWPCPECQGALAAYDHSEERVWRHLDSCQFLTYLHAKPPRVKCAEHGVKQVKLPWAEPKARFTLLFERLAIDVLLEASVEGARRLLRLSWDEAWHILERAVERGLAKKQPRVREYLGVDEKAVAKGQKYLTLVYDLDRATVDYIAEERKQSSLDAYFQSQSKEQLEGIQGIAMDMWEPFFQSATRYVPEAAGKIVFDRYHIVSHLEEAVDKVRRQENRDLLAAGDSSLVRSKYLWLYNEENIPERHRARFDEIKALNLKTASAWAIKESFRDFWSYQSPTWALKFFKSWYFWATHSRLKPIIRVAKMIKNHLANVVTFFKARITNAVAEGLNAAIGRIKKMAYGFRNKEHFKAAIYFHCGGLPLYPPTHAIP